MAPLPSPLVPADVDLRGLEWMPLYGNRLFGSDFDAHVGDTAFRAALQLWWAAWNQTPAASLPDDDVALCRLAGLGRDGRTWRRIKSAALRGFILCSDGRLYHRALSVWAVEAGDRRRRDRERKAKWRAGQERGQGQGQPLPVRVPGTGDKTGEDRTGQDSKKNAPSLADSEARTIDQVPFDLAEPDYALTIPPYSTRNAGRAQPITPHWLPTQNTLRSLTKLRPDLNPERIRARTNEFRCWCAETNKHSHDFDATWLNFMVKTHAELASKTGDKPNSADKFQALADFGREDFG